MNDGVFYKNELYQWPITKIQLEQLYLNYKLSGEYIAGLFGVTSGTISYYRKKYNIPKIESWQRLNVPDKLSLSEEEIVLGYLLGDGHVHMCGHHANLRVAQCQKQESFVNEMHALLHRWASYNPVVDKRLDKRFNKFYYTCRFDTIGHPEFTRLYNFCYPNGIKRVTKEWLKCIGPLGLTLWYQGDGFLSCKVSPVFNTNSFSEDEHKLMVSWLAEKFSIDAYYRPTGKYYVLCIKSSDYFKELIEPHIIPEFRYKLPNKRKRQGCYKYGLL